MLSQWGRWERLLFKRSPTVFLENINGRSCNDGNRELIPVFHNPHRKNPDPLLTLVASLIELTTSRMEALKAQRPYASSLETFTQSNLHRA